MLSDEWLSRYGLLENFNASVTRTGTRTRTRTGTGTWTTGVTAIALCTSCSRAKNHDMYAFLYVLSIHKILQSTWRPDSPMCTGAFCILKLTIEHPLTMNVSPKILKVVQF